MKQEQREIERSAREAWKWQNPTELSSRFLRRRQLTIANKAACCTPSTTAKDMTGQGVKQVLQWIQGDGMFPSYT